MRNSEAFELALRQTGVDIAAAPGEIAAFAAARGAHLASFGQVPGFLRAVEAEADSVWMFAVRRALRTADATDARAWGLIQGLLMGLATA
jgi:hypothetical protein